MAKTITVSDTHDLLNPNSMTFEERERELNAMEKADTEARERAKRSPFQNFVQLNNKHQKELRAIAKENVNSFLVLSFMMEHMDGYNALMCSYQVFQEALNIKRTTASNAVKLLVERGFIHVKKSGRSNVYILNDNLVWKSYGKNTKYCEFPANVVLSSSEQIDVEQDVKEKRTVIVTAGEEEKEKSE